MLRCMILGAAAIALTTPAMAACLEDRFGAQCDIFLDQYRADEVPVGTTMVWPDGRFVVEDLYLPGFETGGVANPADDLTGDDVLYWNGQNSFFVPDASGPPISIAEW